MPNETISITLDANNKSGPVLAGSIAQLKQFQAAAEAVTAATQRSSEKGVEAAKEQIASTKEIANAHKEVAAKAQESAKEQVASTKAVGDAHKEVAAKAQDAAQKQEDAFRRIALAATAAAAAIAYYTVRTVERIDALDKEARSLGATTAQLITFKFAMQQSGLSAEDTSAALSFLSRNIALASDEATPAALAFRKLHVQFQAGGENRKPIDVMLDIADAISKIGDTSEKTRLVSELFGRGQRQLVDALSQGSRAIKEQQKAAEDLGLTVSKEVSAKFAVLSDQLGFVKAGLKGAAQSILIEFLPALIEVSKESVKAAKGIREFITARPGVQAGFLGMASAIGVTTTALIGYRAITAIGAKLTTGLVATLGALALRTTAIGVTLALVFKSMSELGKEEAAAAAARENDKLAESLKKVIDEKEKLKLFNEDEAFAARFELAGTAQLPVADRAAELERLKQEIGTIETKRDLTKEELDNKMAGRQFDIEHQKFLKDGFEINFAGDALAKRKLEQLQKEHDLLIQNFETLSDLEKQGLIGTLELAQKRNELNRQYLEINKEAAEIQRRVSDHSFGDQFQSAILGLKTAAQEVGAAFGTIFGSMGHELGNLIRQTQTWGQFLQHVGDIFLDAILQAIVNTVVAFAVGEAAKTGILGAHAAARAAVHTTETVTEAAHVATRVSTHAVGEGTKTGTTLFGSISRGAIWLGETIFHGIQTAIKVATHIVGETAMTGATIVGAAIRIPLTIAEAIPNLIKAAMKAASSVADIPYVGPILAIAAMASVIAAGAKYVGGFEEGGYTGPGGRKQVAGVVHAGEYVFSQDDVARHGIGGIEAFRHGNSNLPGYERGGFVQPVGGSDQTINIVTLSNHSEIENYLSTTKGKSFLVNSMRGVVHELGIRS